MSNRKFETMIDDQIASINQIPLKMAVQVEVIAIEENLIQVNGKSVRKDMNENWIAAEELTSMETKFFREFLGSLRRVSTDTLKATYKI